MVRRRNEPTEIRLFRQELEEIRRALAGKLEKSEVLAGTNVTVTPSLTRRQVTVAADDGRDLIVAVYAVNFQGAWSSAGVTYTAGDVVTNNGSTYIAIEEPSHVSSTGNEPGTTGGAEEWSVLAQAGADGSAGGTLGGLSDVDLTGLVNGQAIIYNSTSGNWEVGSAAAGPLSGLSDVTFTSLSAAEFIRWNGSAWVNVTLQGSDIPDLSGMYLSSSSGLSALNDVNITSVQTNNLIRWNGSAWVNVLLELGDISNIDLTGLSDGEVLVYNSTSGNWEPGNASTVAAIGDLTDVTISTPAGDHLIFYDGAGWANRALVAGDIPDISATYALATHTHAASAITSGTFDVARIPDLSAAYALLTGSTFSGLVTLNGGVTIDSNLQLKDNRTILFENGLFDAGLAWNPTENWTLELPAADGSANQAMRLNGSGTLEWFTPVEAETGLGFSTRGVVFSDSTFDLTLDATPTESYSISLPPDAPPGANYIMQSDASGNLSWIATPTGGGNTAPVVNAGADFNQVQSTSFSITATATDADSDTMTYSWTQTGGTTISGLTGTTTLTLGGTAPAYVDGTSADEYTFQFTADDGTTTSSDTVVMTVISGNTAPTVDTISVSPTSDGPGQTITLTATASDADSDPLTYQWTQTAGTSVGTITNATSLSATFTSPSVAVTENLTFQFAVNDGTETTTDTVQFEVTADQDPTVSTSPASATLDELSSGQTITTTASDDAGGVTYAWTQTTGTTASITGGTTSSSLTFDVPAFDHVTSGNNTLTFRCTVTDVFTGTQTAFDETVITVANLAPVIDSLVANDTTPTVDQTITLTANVTDNDTLTYLWTQTAGTSVGTITNDTTSVASFTAPSNTVTNETLTFNCRVRNQTGATQEQNDTINLTLQQDQPPSNTVEADKSVNEATATTVTTTASDDGATLTYLWTQTSGTDVTGSWTGTTTATVSFTTPAFDHITSGNNSLVFNCRVTDSGGQFTDDTHTMTVNEVPVTITGSWNGNTTDFSGVTESSTDGIQYDTEDGGVDFLTSNAASLRNLNSGSHILEFKINFDSSSNSTLYFGPGNETAGTSQGYGIIFTDDTTTTGLAYFNSSTTATVLESATTNTHSNWTGWGTAAQVYMQVDITAGTSVRIRWKIWDVGGTEPGSFEGDYIDVTYTGESMGLLFVGTSSP